jgi:hypothetical protein
MLRSTLAWGAAIPMVCIALKLAGDDIPFVVLGAPGLLAAWIVIGEGGPQWAGLLAYWLVNSVLWGLVLACMKRFSAAVARARSASRPS